MYLTYNRMTKTNILFLVILLCFTRCFSPQDKTALHYASMIDSANLRITLTTLASDEFEGRGTNEKGGDTTLKYLEEYLRSKGVTPGNKGSYFQSIGAKVLVEVDKRFMFDGFNNEKEYKYENIMDMDTLLGADQLLCIAYGPSVKGFENNANLNIAGQVILIVNGVSVSKTDIRHDTNRQMDNYFARKKPKAIIRIAADFNGFQRSITGGLHFTGVAQGQVPTLSVTEHLANQLLASTGKSAKQLVKEVEQADEPISTVIDKKIAFNGYYRYKDANAKNIIAFIEGKELKDEYIVITAHHDHLGKEHETIYNGADDNASGVSALLEIATLFTKAKKEDNGPRRSIVIIFPSAEERGLRGSNYYVRHPIYPLEQTKACINLDMIGRRNTDDKENDRVYLIHNEKMSGELPELVKQANAQSMQLTIEEDLSFIEGSQYLFQTSDHYFFAKKGIPSIAFTSGLHQEYHTEADDTELIDFRGLFKRTQLAFLLAWELADKDHVVSQHKP